MDSVSELSLSKHTYTKKLYDIAINNNFVERLGLSDFCCDFVKCSINDSSQLVLGVPAVQHSQLFIFVYDASVI
jgi:hypothetical protein